MSLLPGKYNLMPLSKKLCQKCVNKTEDIGWKKKYDEERWDVGEVLCPLIYIGKERRTIKIKDKPPPKCPFILEHILTKEE